MRMLGPIYSGAGGASSGTTSNTGLPFASATLPPTSLSSRNGCAPADPSWPAGTSRHCPFTNSRPPNAVIAALEIGNHAVSFAKFRREASPHHYLSKAFGLGLWLLFAMAFTTGAPGVVLWCVFALGVASQLEAFAITLRLKAWRCDVPSVITLR